MTTRTLTVVLAGDAKGAVGALGRTDSSFGKLAKGAGLAAVATGAAFAAIGAKGVANAKALEEGLAEVRTLLPELTDGGFDQLRKDVIAFSDDMGVATTEAVPALYQAISAGVPRENAITFLETASKAAIGGVTELETAVDGITSVVNAYGAESITAAEASDLMFTAVRLGKTDFEQLSSSLFNVAPVAKNAGVEFGTVTAAIASLTAQGTPTTVATTQLRQAILALVAPGKATAGIMREMGLEFDAAKLAEVGLAGAFQDVVDAADGDLQVLRSLLGSTEALNAVLGLTGENASGFAANLDAMANSTGATDAAFATMDDTLSRRWERTLTRVNNMITRLGFVLLPYVDQALAVLIATGERFAAWAQETLVPALRDWYAEIAERVGPVLAELAEWVTGTALPALVSFGAWLRETGMPALAEFAEMVGGTVVEKVREFVGWFTDNVLPSVLALSDWITGVGLPALIDFATTVSERLAPVLLALGEWLVGDGQPALIALGVALGVLLGPFGLVTAAVVGLSAGLIALWTHNEQFRETVTALAGDLGAIAGPAFERFRETAVTVFDNIREALAAAWVAIQEVTDRVLRPIFEDILATALDEFGTLWRDTIEPLQPVFAELGDFVEGVWNDVLSPILEVAAIVALGVLGTAFVVLARGVEMAIKQIANVLTFAIGVITDTVKLADALIRGDWSAAWDAAKSLAMRPLTLLTEFVEGWVEAIQGIVGDFGRALGISWDDIWQGLLDGLRAIGRQIVGAVASFARQAMAPVQGLIDLINSIPAVPDIPDVGDIAGGIVSKIPGFAKGGMVPGPEGSPHLAVVHGGERVLSVAEQRGGMMGGGGGNTYITIQVDAAGGDPERIGEALFPGLQALVRRGMIKFETA